MAAKSYPSRCRTSASCPPGEVEFVERPDGLWTVLCSNGQCGGCKGPDADQLAELDRLAGCSYGTEQQHGGLNRAEMR